MAEAAWCRENDLIDSTCTLGRFGSFSDLFRSLVWMCLGDRMFDSRGQLLPSATAPSLSDA